MTSLGCLGNTMGHWRSSQISGEFPSYFNVLKGPVLAIMLCVPLVVVFVFTGARRPLLLKSSTLPTNKSLRIFNITKMAAKRSQLAMLNGQYRVFNISVLLGSPETAFIVKSALNPFIAGWCGKRWLKVIQNYFKFDMARLHCSWMNWLSIVIWLISY